jgi:drug/metabolite transporter (DMT)-like permease
MPLWGFILSFVIATLWAASPIMVGQGLAVSKCTSNEINPIRSISYLAVSVIIALIYTGGNITIVKSPLALFYIFSGVFLSYTVGDILYFIAIKDLGVSLAVPISNAYPILVTFTSWFILDEQLSLQIFIGTLIVVTGLLLLRFGRNDNVVQPSVKSDASSKKTRIMRGFVLAIAAGCAWAIAAPITKLSMSESGLGAVEITMYRSVVFFIVTWSIRLITVKFCLASTVPISKVPIKSWLYFLGAAVIGLCLGSIMYASCINVMPVAIVTAITATSPFMAALFGHFVLKEYLLPLQWCGVVMIIAGSITVSL